MHALLGKKATGHKLHHKKTQTHAVELMTQRKTPRADYITTIKHALQI